MDPSGEEWTQHMNDISDKIAQLTLGISGVISGTEQQFLYIGSRLNHIYTEAENISRQVSSLVNMLDSTAIKETLERFRGVVAEMERRIDMSQESFQSGLITLQNMNGAVSDVGIPLTNFRKIVKKLKILGISTKIESAQLKRMESDFQNLANDVEQLSIMINDKSTAINNHRVSLLDFSAGTLKKIVGLNRKSMGHIDEILVSLKDSLSILEDRYRISFTVADSILNRFNMTSQRVSDVVMSMQFHDITRQQVDHIIEVLEVLHEKLQERCNDSVDTALAGLQTARLAETVIACELQRAQLIDARNKFILAVDTIRQNINGIADNMFDIREDVRKITEGVDRTSHSFLTDIESGTSAVIAGLEENNEADRNLFATIDELSSAVSTISNLVDDIEAIGEEIELIAVNARIKAARTGGDGAPLGVIAEAIWHLSIDATSQKITISHLLRNIVAATRELHDAMALKATDSDTYNIVAELSKILGGLKNLKEDTDGLIDSVETGSRKLADDVEDTINNFTVDKDMGHGVDLIVKDLDALLQDVRQMVTSEELEMARRSSVQYITDNYTMQRERAIHSHIESNILPFGDKDKKGKINEKDPTTVFDHLGDNVELF